MLGKIAQPCLRLPIGTRTSRYRPLEYPYEHDPNLPRSFCTG